MTLLNESEAAIYLGCSRHKLQKDRRKGSLIPYIKIGRSVKYRLSNLDAYLQQNTFTSTSEYSEYGGQK